MVVTQRYENLSHSQLEIFYIHMLVWSVSYIARNEVVFKFVAGCVAHDGWKMPLTM